MTPMMVSNRSEETSLRGGTQGHYLGPGLGQAADLWALQPQGEGQQVGMLVKAM